MVPVTVSVTVSSRRNYQMFDSQFDKYNTTIWKTCHSWQVPKLYSTELWDWKSDISVQISIINQFCYACKSKQITLVVFEIGYGRIGELSMSVMFAADESFFVYLQIFSLKHHNMKTCYFSEVFTRHLHRMLRSNLYNNGEFSSTFPQFLMCYMNFLFFFCFCLFFPGQ